MKEFGIVVCASGGGGNFKSLIDHQGLIGFSILKLIVDRVCGAISVAEKSGIKVEIINYKGNSNFSEDFINAIPAETDLIVLAGFLSILPEIVCERFKYKIINTHPSLLPKYGGKGMYGVKIQETVMANHEEKAGCTVHYVTKDVDAGDIILQKEVDVDCSETPWQLGGRIFNEEIKLLPEAIRILKGQRHIMVSVCCLVYNHEPYLRECFNGFVMQKTTFPIEILVHDDASSDHSAEIIREYTAKYPDIFKPIYQTENQFSKGVDVFSFNARRAIGKYIAICEGDDYWTDPYKLQKQVDFLEDNSDFALCFHNVKIWKQKEGIMVDDFITRDVPSESDIYELANGNYIHTPSVIYRNDNRIIEAVRKMGRLGVGDYPMWMLSAQYGRLKKMNECMAVYRYGSGIWSSESNYSKVIIKWLNMLCKIRIIIEDEKVRSILDEQIEMYSLSLENKFVQIQANYDSISNSHAYNLGCFILKPVYWLKRMCNNSK